MVKGEGYDPPGRAGEPGLQEFRGVSHSSEREEGRVRLAALRIRRVVSDHPVATVFLLALFARVTVAVTVHVVHGGALFGDDATYPQMAAAAARGETAGWDGHTRELYRTTWTFTLPLTALYELLGPSVLAGQLLVALFGALAAAATTRLALEAVPAPWAAGSGLVVALLPSQVLFSSLVLKDALVWVAVATLAMLVALAGRDNGRRLLLFTAATVAVLVALAFLRRHSFVVAIWAMAIATWLGCERRRLLCATSASVIAIALPLVLGLGPAGLGLVADAGSLDERRAKNAAGAGTAFVPDDTQLEYARVRSDLESARAETQRLRRQLSDAREQAVLAAQRLEEAERDAEDAEREAEEARTAGDEAAAEREEQRAGRAELRARQARKALVEVRTTAEALAARLGEAEETVEKRESVTEAVETRAARRDLDEWYENEFDSERTQGQVGRSLQALGRGVSVMLLEPYPWRPTSNPSIRMAQVENGVWYPLVALALVGLVSLRRHARVLVFPALFGGAIVLTYALVEGNFGTAYRHRGEFVWIVALFAVFGARRLWSLLRFRRASAGNDGSGSRSG